MREGIMTPGAAGNVSGVEAGAAKVRKAAAGWKVGGDERLCPRIHSRVASLRATLLLTSMSLPNIALPVRSTP